MPTVDELERIAAEIVDSAIAVHRALGPGLLESAYGACLTHELDLRGVAVRRQVRMPVTYQGLEIEAGYRLDMLVADAVIVENKAVRDLAAIHQAQLLTYLRLSGLKLGFLINWHVPRLVDGLQRMVHRY